MATNPTQTSIIVGCDHAAYPLKEKVKMHLIRKGIDVVDVGTDSEDSVDYTQYDAQVASQVSTGKFDRGILLCGTGLGMSMVANKYPHVRASLCNDLFSAIMGRRHNDANILVMGGRVIGEALAGEIVNAWLETPFEGGRHQGRIDNFESFERIEQRRRETA